MPYTQKWGISRNAFQSPLHNNGEEDNQATNIIRKNNIKTRRGWLDWAQDALTVAGMVPGIGNIADAANVAVSGGRAAYSHFTGDRDAAKTHLGNAALSAAAAVPIVGQAAGAAKLVKSAKTIKALDLGGKLALKSTKLAKSGATEVELAENRRKQNVLQSSDVLAGDSETNSPNPFVSRPKNIFV